jgi:hypothetical protein
MTTATSDRTSVTRADAYARARKYVSKLHELDDALGVPAESPAIAWQIAQITSDAVRDLRPLKLRTDGCREWLRQIVHELVTINAIANGIDTANMLHHWTQQDSRFLSLWEHGNALHVAVTRLTDQFRSPTLEWERDSARPEAAS